MTHYELATIGAMVTGPLAAVLITLWHQDRAQKKQAKLQLFMTLMANRKSNPPTLEWANALNLIDVVYADSPKVVRLWHEGYDILCREKIGQDWNHKYLELLSAMASTLRYRRLQQTDIDKFYSPIAHGNIAQLNSELASELLRVLKATQSLSGMPRTTEKEDKFPVSLATGK